jgi:hypothetical protein
MYRTSAAHRDAVLSAVSSSPSKGSGFNDGHVTGNR